jgi:hypothetical protein
VNLKVRVVGKKLAAIATLKSAPSVTAVIPEILIPGMFLTGSVGLYRSNRGYENRFDNIVVSNAEPVGTSRDNITAYAYGDGKLSVGDSVKMRDYEFPIV